MAALPYIVTYAALGVFIVAVIARFLMWSKMPLHVRWELYPVAHEASRAHYGGSYLEEVDWWKKPREKSLVGELKAMIPEILFLVALKEHNPKMWARSFPFHFGLYLVIGATCAMFLAAILAAISPTIVLGGFGKLLGYVVTGCAYGGLALGLLGALGLLQRRLTDPGLKDFTSPADIFNLLLFVVAFGTALAHLLLADPRLVRSTAFVYGLVTFDFAPLGATALENALLAATVLLLALVTAYVPLTHMSHFVGKFFAYHAIRWNDEPNLKGGPEEEKIKQVLSYPVSWAAAHIGGDGKKNWVDVATTLPTEEPKK